MSCPTARTAAAFAFASVAASTLASVGRSSPLGLPLITGYLVAGAAAGPYVLGMLTHDDCTSLADLINNDAMGFIGFSAGTKFLLSDMEGTIQPTLVLLTALVLVTYGLVGSCFYFAAPYLPLTAGQTPEVQLATSMVIACLAVARSPSSAIALITELGARGAFTTMTLSLTVLTDVIVVVLFAVTMLLVHAIVGDGGGGQPGWVVLASFAAQIAVSVLIGVVLGYAMDWTVRMTAALHAKFRLHGGGSMASTGDRRSISERVACPAAVVLSIQVAIVLAESMLMQLTGFGIFESEQWEEKTWGGTFHQPLIISMVAGFTVANYTPSRLEFLRILHDSSEVIYIAFFTLTGASLQLDVLLVQAPTALFLFAFRAGGIVLGAKAGAYLVDAEPAHRDKYWMTLLTQAGVTLGLITRVGDALPISGELTTLVIATVVLNQFVGPPLFKAAVLAVGDAHADYAPADGGRLGVLESSRPKARCAVIVSAAGDWEAKALTLRLQRRGWRVLECGMETGRELPARQQRRVPGRGRIDRRERRFKQALRAGHVIGAEKFRADGSVLERSTRKPSALGKQPSGAVPLLDKGAGPSLGEWELQLLWAISSLDALDVLVLLQRDDDANLIAMRHLGGTASLLPELLKWQTVTPQLLVEVNDIARQEEYEKACPPQFRLTLVCPTLAIPNLFAEMLHPDCHWTLEIDNDKPLSGHPVAPLGTISEVARDSKTLKKASSDYGGFGGRESAPPFQNVPESPLASPGDLRDHHIFATTSLAGTGIPKSNTGL